MAKTPAKTPETERPAGADQAEGAGTEAGAASQAAAPAVDESLYPANGVHTYPDGSQVYGAPPWPKLSPLQRAAQAAKDAE